MPIPFMQATPPTVNAQSSSRFLDQDLAGDGAPQAFIPSEAILRCSMKSQLIDA